jgi:LCP family protein required for cell wall assembly
VLLLGSDYRPSSPGNRTDAIMVVSLDPASGQVGAFSVPRDTAGFPLPEGGTFKGKINALYQWYEGRNGHGLASMEKAMAEAYGIEIDYGVLTTFAGVRQLVDAVGGVTVTLAKSYYDPAYWVNSHTQGWGLSAGTHKLTGATALIFARSRKGDNDFKRAARQQQLVQAAATKVLAQGSAILPKLLAVAARTTGTDLPLARALDIYSLVATAKVAKAKTKVFGPTKYATGSGGTSFKPNLAACRAWIKANFPPANPGAVWPPKS